jgi:hypothetical protein
MTGITKASLTDQITRQLPLILGREISHVQPGFHEESLPGTVLKIFVFENDQSKYPLILKRQDNDVNYRLYKQVLEPFHLNSPRQYGYLWLDGQRFLVLEYIHHLPIDWEDPRGYLRAVNWLVKKDLILMQNLESVRKLDCLGEMPYYGVDYWLENFEKWRQDSPGDSHAQAVWGCFSANQNKIREYISELNEQGAQTVVHGDLSLDNILFVGTESLDELYVIDWTQPHLSSVAKDLNDLVQSAPDKLKGDLVRTYRQQIDFQNFDQLLADAKILGDIGFLSWMAWMINIGFKNEIGQNEIDRDASSFLSAMCGI